MSIWFCGNEKKQSAGDADVTTECKKCEITEHNALVEKYRLLKEQELFSVRDKIYNDFKHEHNRQSLGYVLKLQRWGNFLNLYIERNGNIQDTDYISSLSNPYEAAINLNTVNRIEFIAGSPVENTVDVRYEIQEVPSAVKDDDKFSFTNTRWHGDYRGYHNMPEFSTKRCIVQPIYNDLPPCVRPYFITEKGLYAPFLLTSYRYSGRDNPLPTGTKNFPRPSIDDRIAFHGSDFNLQVPYGMGHDIYTKILKAKDARK